MIEFIDKTAEADGTKINRKNLMAIQGFIGMTTAYTGDDVVTETNSEGQTKTTTFNPDGSIVEVFTGDKTITKTTTIDSNGNVTEVLS